MSKRKCELSAKVLVLIRHGDYNLHETSKFQTLTSCGKKQAESAGNALINIPKLPEIRKIYCSTMPRAKETYSIISNVLPSTIEVKFDHELEEGNASMPHVVDRFERVYKNLFVPVQGSEKKTEVVVSHGNLIRFMICR